MQTLENQKHEIENYCRNRSIHVDKWVRESVSGTVAWEKRGLGRLIRKMKKGDLLICSEISRLGRNILMIMSVLNECSRKGISILTIKDNFELNDSLNSKIIAFAFALASEIERNLISQRTREALAVRKMSGVKLGRPKGETARVQRCIGQMSNIIEEIEGGRSISSLARAYGVHRNTMAAQIKKYIGGREDGNDNN